MKKLLPWWAKVSAKIVLSKLPVPYRTFEKLGMFRHGDMMDTGYALQVFESHRARLPSDGAVQGLSCLELGPGDSLASALIGAAHGAAHIELVDAGDFARRDLPAYKQLAADLRARGLSVPDIEGAQHMEQMLKLLNARYRTNGLKSLREIPDNSIDFIWSQAVLEHVRHSEFDATLAELARILRPTGIASHRVDLQDHLAHSLNNLRFRHEQWEAPWMASSGFYTNRIRFSDMLKRFQSAGFDVQVNEVDRWATLPIKRSRLQPEFARLDDEELRVRGFSVTMTLS